MFFDFRWSLVVVSLVIFQVNLHEAPHEMLCYDVPMWFFRRERPKPRKIMKRVIVGLIIGGAIGSIIGKKMMENQEDEKEREDND